MNQASQLNARIGFTGHFLKTRLYHIPGIMKPLERCLGMSRIRIGLQHQAVSPAGPGNLHRSVQLCFRSQIFDHSCIDLGDRVDRLAVCLAKKRHRLIHDNGILVSGSYFDATFKQDNNILMLPRATPEVRTLDVGRDRPDLKLDPVCSRSLHPEKSFGKSKRTLHNVEGGFEHGDIVRFVKISAIDNEARAPAQLAG